MLSGTCDVEAKVFKLGLRLKAWIIMTREASPQSITCYMQAIGYRAILVPHWLFVVVRYDMLY